MTNKINKQIKNHNINWSNHIIELIVVFIGISGAFALNNWNDARVEREQERKYLKNLLVEIKLDNQQLIEIINTTEQDSGKIDSLMLMLKNKEHDLKKVLPFLNIMSKAEQFNPRIVTFESIKNSGGLETISNFDLRNLITENYLLYNSLILVEEIIFEFLKNHWMPYSMKQFDVINGKIVNEEFIKEVEFGNLVGGYFSSLGQQLNSYRKTQKKCYELLLALEKAVN